MKALPILAIIALFITACTNQNHNTATVDTATAIKEQDPEATTDTLCFQRTSGLKNQDTTSVRFVITGNEVTGNMINKPAEKDSRKGTLQATKQGSIIKGLWLYMQEGMQDTLSVEFKISSDKLMQKGYTFNKTSGREVLNDNSDYKTEYLKIDCAAFPK